MQLSYLGLLGRCILSPALLNRACSTCYMNITVLRPKQLQSQTIYYRGPTADRANNFILHWLHCMQIGIQKVIPSPYLKAVWFFVLLKPGIIQSRDLFGLHLLNHTSLTLIAVNIHDFWHLITKHSPMMSLHWLKGTRHIADLSCLQRRSLLTLKMRKIYSRWCIQARISTPCDYCQH